MRFMITLCALLLMSAACSRNSESIGSGAGKGAPSREGGSATGTDR